MNLILLGAPGAGKGTLASYLIEQMGVPSISTGNILREAIKNNTPLGQSAKEYMDAGKLVPDEVVIGMLKERIAKRDCKSGFILDGFPRTIPQAEALDKMGVTIDKVLEIYVPDETIKERVSGRRVCEGCGASYHIKYKPTKGTKAYFQRISLAKASLRRYNRKYGAVLTDCGVEWSLHSSSEHGGGQPAMLRRNLCFQVQF